jgi:hypothetical protein
LGLKENDTELIVAKDIRDGVIEAVIDHENKVLQSKVLKDVYMTNEPQGCYRRELGFTLDLGMRLSELFSSFRARMKRKLRKVMMRLNLICLVIIMIFR